MKEGTLVPSTNQGRYAIGSPDGTDLTSGTVCAIKLDGGWIVGTVEYAGNLYLHTRDVSAVHGYYFLSEDRLTYCGLCLGMICRI